MKKIISTVFIVVVAIGFVAGLCRAKPPASAEPLQPVRFQQIQLGGFWKQQVKLQTEKWIPHCIEQMEEGGRGRELLNLVATAQVLQGKSHDPYTGAPWSDAYVYNTVEAICLALAVDSQGDAELARAQQFLRDKLEEWIPIILAAQMDDGYIHSFHTVNGHPRYSNIDWHEFYVMGYFIEMGVAHYRMTGGEDRRLYDAAVRCADQLCDTFGPPPKRTWKNGHPGMEYALFRLARLVDEVEGPGRGDKYAQLAKHFLDHQHEILPDAYNQSECPAVEMENARGHAVRATYFYTAMADVALRNDDPAYRGAVDKIWANAIHRKHYITGGVGASHAGEAFGEDFDLHNDGYCESCAGCGLSFWADRMHRLRGDAHYQDVLERVLYNNILGAVERSGENFFYQNPLQSAAARYPWHGCPCCVGNIPRALIDIKDYIYSINNARDTLYLNQFVDSEGTISDVAGGELHIRQETGYPWQGDVKLTLHPAAPTEFGLKIRIPDRTESDLYTAEPDLTGRFTLKVNGRPQSPPIERGYVEIRRTWQDGDQVELVLPMDVQRIRCDERVVVDRGRVALQRGPLVYNVEDVDNPVPANALVLKPDVELTADWKGDLLGGVMVIQGEGITAGPNFARLNRGGASQVWIVEDPEKIAPTIRLGNGMEISAEPIVRPELDERTIDRVAIAVVDSEKQHNLRGERTDCGVFHDRPWRHAGGGWFSYELAVRPEGPQTLLCTYWGDDVGNRRFDILLDGRKIGSQVLDRNRPGEFFDVEYAIPESLTRGKNKVTVKLQAEPGATAGGIFDLRVLKAKP